MDFRLASPEDLPQLKAVYKKIIEHMEQNQIGVWDDIYPCEFFKEDIEQNRLYILTENDKILSAFALCSSNAGENSVKWRNARGKAMYVDRLGVNVNYLRKGIGSVTLEKAASLAGGKGAEYLRLFVVDRNRPAISLYLKNGFEMAEGIFDEAIDGGLVLHEFGFEKETQHQYK